MSRQYTNQSKLHLCGLLLSSSIFLVACSSSDSTDDDNDDGDNTPDTVAATFTNIQDTIFTPRCTQCHAGDTPAASLSLEAGSSYEQLVDVQATNAPNVRVITGDSAQSFIIRKVRGTDLTETEGSRMPLNGPPFLEDSEIDLIAQWIDAGAANN